MSTSGSIERSMFAKVCRPRRSAAGGAVGTSSSAAGCWCWSVGPTSVMHIGSQDPVVDSGGPVSLPDSLPSSPGAGFRADRPAPDRNLALELVRVTEAAAMAAGRWVGRGDKNGGGGAAPGAPRAPLRPGGLRGGGRLGGGGQGG